MVISGFPIKRRIISLMTAFFEKPAKHKEYDLILVRGAPGVGKTTLAKRLRAHFPKGITIEVDSFKGMVNLLDWKDTTQYHHILEAVAMTCRSYLEQRLCSGDHYRYIIIRNTGGFYGNTAKISP